MATTTSKTTTTAADAATPRVPPVLGAQITVRVAEGQQLINSETGTYFGDGVDTPQTVTVTTLKRLADGDLVQVG